MNVRSIVPLIGVGLLLLAGCTTGDTYAPVVNAWQDPAAMKSRYRVQKDDTVYSIALAFDIDYRDLVKANGLVPPYRLTPGETLTMYPASSEAATVIKAVELIEPVLQPTAPKLAQSRQPLKAKSASESPLPAYKYDSSFPTESSLSAVKEKGKLFRWPVKGRIVKAFALKEGGNKGIDIAGELGEPIKAAAAGKVVYSGCGLRGYGNLIILKHSDNYLSAYAYNKKLLVKEGDSVKAGTEIAKMGQNNSGQVLLHFEIRLNGKPVDPLLYL